MLTPEIIATREATLGAHLEGETNKDVDMVLDTFAGEPKYDLVPSGIVITGRENVGKVTRDQIREIATIKLADLNANDIDAAMAQVQGTARSMGIEVEG